MTPNQLAADLRAARELVAAGWCQGAYARTKSGRPIGPRTPGAACFCPLGAAQRVVLAGGYRYAAMVDAMNAACPNYGIAHWNDTTGRRQATVWKMLDRAIAAAEKSA